MVLLKPKIDVKIENSITDKNGSILVEAIFDETKYIFEMFKRQTSKHRQIQCLRDLSNNVINNSANKKIISLVAITIGHFEFPCASVSKRV